MNPIYFWMQRSKIIFAKYGIMFEYNRGKTAEILIKLGECYHWKENEAQGQGIWKMWAWKGMLCLGLTLLIYSQVWLGIFITLSFHKPQFYFNIKV